jgi:hypothetical protein
MNIQQSQFISNANKPWKLTGRLIIPLLLVISSSTHANDSFQQKVIFTPSNSSLTAEANGRVMIYNGLKSDMVDEVMNEQFDRIENMKFVGTQYLQENGEYEAEDEGCE